MVGGIRGFIDTGSKFVFENLNDVIQDAIGNWDVLISPGDVFDDWNLDWGEVVITEAALFLFGPSKAELIELEDVL